MVQMNLREDTDFQNFPLQRRFFILAASKNADRGLPIPGIIQP